jgi:hypothetical protein
MLQLLPQFFAGFEGRCFLRKRDCKVCNAAVALAAASVSLSSAFRSAIKVPQTKTLSDDND